MRRIRARANALPHSRLPPVLSALAERTLHLRLARSNPETPARHAQLVRQSGAETVRAWRSRTEKRPGGCSATSPVPPQPRKISSNVPTPSTAERLPGTTAPMQAAEYWKTTLSDVPELLELPTDHARPARQDCAGASVGVELDAELSARLEALSRRHGATPYMALLAGWAVVLGRLSGQADVVIGTPTAGRGRRETEGPVVANTLAIRVDLSGAPSVAELLDTGEGAGARGQQRHQDVPFEQVVDCAAGAQPGAPPLFQVTFAWRDTPGGDGPSLPAVEAGSGLAGDVEAGPSSHACRRSSTSRSCWAKGGADRRQRDICDGALRTDDGGALGRLPAAGAGGDGRGRHAAGRSAGAAARGRAHAGGGGVEPHGGGVSARVVRPRALEAQGSARPARPHSSSEHETLTTRS